MTDTFASDYLPQQRKACATTTEMSYNETVDDVLADMLLPRFDAITAMRANNYDEIKSLVANYRDRLKAALKRERGNAAKLREALKCLMDNLNIHLMQPTEMITVNRAELDGMVMTCEKALTSPPRNCDVYNNESCRMAYHLHGDGLMTMQAFANWLFAPATEKEGGAK